MTGDLLVQDGPFADIEEQRGGTIVINVPDLDAAIAWAEKASEVPRGMTAGPTELRCISTIDIARCRDARAAPDAAD